jgi:cyclomaltodextrinase
MMRSISPGSFFRSHRVLNLILVFAISCSQAAFGQAPFPAVQAIPNVVQPVTLNKDTTHIYLADYFIQPEQIDSVSFSKGIKHTWSKKDNTVTVVAQEDLKPLTEMKLWSKGFAYSIVLKRSARKKYEFTYDPNGKELKTVQLTGELNDWTPARTPFHKEGGVWKASIELNPGVYQYQIVVDGTRMLDPANKEKVDNNNGGFNSVFKAGADQDAKPSIATSKLGRGSFTVAVNFKRFPFSVAFYWQNFRLGKGYVKRAGDEMMVMIPEEAKKMQRSYIRVYANDDDALSNDILVPLQYGEVVNDPSLITRSDKQADEMYFVLVDRFCDGDPSNNKKVVHPEIKEKANYYGGDLEGVQKQIDNGYFKSLHVNTLWISPIVQNPEKAFKEFPEPHDWYSGYHGYWPISLTRVDQRFGGEKAFKQMVDDAHKNNINVLIDLVANHVHEDYPLIKKHPEWRTKLDLPDGRKNIRLWDEYRLTTWFDTFLPTLDFTNKDVLKLEVDSSAFWIQHYGVDGFRHDATKHIPESFWRALTLKLKKETTRPLYQLGETYGSKELIGSYIGSGMLDGQFDFNLHFDTRVAFAKDDGGFDKVAATLQQSIDYYGSHHLMGNISGNHDLPRFASLAGGGLSFSEDPRKAGWERDVKMGSDSAYDKMAMLIAFINAIPGVPVIYYGDEIAMPGAGDPDNRRMMVFSGLNDKQKQLKETVAKLFALRAENLAVLYGETDVVAKGNIMMIKRTYFSQTVLFVFNKSKVSQSVETGLNLSDFKPAFGHASTGGKVELPPLSFEVFVK